jgi:glutamyl-tRNA reductase
VGGTLVQIGFAQPSVPLVVREKIISATDGGRQLAPALKQHFKGSLVLSTCERFEVFVETRERCAQDVLNLVTGAMRTSGVSVQDLARHARVQFDAEAARHLMSVASGLESRIPGEPHVLGQVRSAYRELLDERRGSPLITALSQAAIRAGKRVRSETDLCRGRPSIVTVVKQQLLRELEIISARRITILGSGTVATDLAVMLGGEGADVTVISHSEQRALALAQRAGGTGESTVFLPELLRRSHALITATRNGVRIEASHFSGRRPQAGTIFVFDLGVPRNVSADVALLPFVKFIDLDTLPRWRVGQHVLSAAQSIVEKELDRFGRWRRSRRVAPLIDQIIGESGGSGSNRSRSGDPETHHRIMRLKAGAAA